jgi:hypothetical protein
LGITLPTSLTPTQTPFDNAGATAVLDDDVTTLSLTYSAGRCTSTVVLIPPDNTVDMYEGGALDTPDDDISQISSTTGL